MYNEKSLTLSLAISLLVKNSFTFEVVPGTKKDSAKHDVIVTAENVPDFVMSFNEQSLGGVLEFSYISFPGGERLRLKEEDVYNLISTKQIAPAWSLVMRPSDQPVVVPLQIIDRKKGIVSGVGEIIEIEEDTDVVKVKLSTGFVVNVSNVRREGTRNSAVAFSGIYQFPYFIEQD